MKKSASRHVAITNSTEPNLSTAECLLLSLLASMSPLLEPHTHPQTPSRRRRGHHQQRRAPLPRRGQEAFIEPTLDRSHESHALYLICQRPLSLILSAGNENLVLAFIIQTLSSPFLRYPLLALAPFQPSHKGRALLSTTYTFPSRSPWRPPSRCPPSAASVLPPTRQNGVGVLPATERGSAPL